MTQDPENEELSFEALVSRVDEDLAELSLESLAVFGETRDPETSRRTADVVQDVRGIEEFSGRLNRVVRCLELLELDRRRLLEHGVDGLTNSGDLKHQATLNPVQEQIGRFRILKELGAGGFGIVFLAEDPVLQRKVAIKIPKPECLVVPDLRERFLWESRLAAKLTHPNIVSIYEAGQDGAITFQVSEYCSGGTLAQFLQSQVSPRNRLAAEAAPGGCRCRVTHQNR